MAAQRGDRQGATGLSRIRAARGARRWLCVSAWMDGADAHEAERQRSAGIVDAQQGARGWQSGRSSKGQQLAAAAAGAAARSMTGGRLPGSLQTELRG